MPGLRARHIRCHRRGMIDRLASMAPLARLACLFATALTLGACPAEPGDRADESGVPPASTNTAVPARNPCVGAHEAAYARGRGLFAYEGVPVRGAFVAGTLVPGQPGVYEMFNHVLPGDVKPACPNEMRETTVFDGTFDLELALFEGLQGWVEIYLDLDRNGIYDPNEPHWAQHDGGFESTAPPVWTLTPAEFERIRNVEVTIRGLPGPYTSALVIADECGYPGSPRPGCAIYRESDSFSSDSPSFDDAGVYRVMTSYDSVTTKTFVADVLSATPNHFPPLVFTGPLGPPHCDFDGHLARCTLTGRDFVPGPPPAPSTGPLAIPPFQAR